MAVIFPDALATATNLVGVVTSIDEDPNSADSNWLVASASNSATTVRVTFPTPSTTLVLGANLQEFRAQVRKTSGASNPTVDLDLYEDGVFVGNLLNDSSITSSSSQILSGTWNVSSLTAQGGTGVECQITTTVGTTPGAEAGFQSAGAVNQSTTLSGSFSIAIPGHTSGDLLLLCAQSNNLSNTGLLGTISTAGWTWLGGTGFNYGAADSCNARMSIAYKIGDGVETVVSVIHTGTGTTPRHCDQVHRFTATNGYATTPLQGAVRSFGLSSSAIVCPTVIPSGIHERAICILGSTFNAAISGPSDEVGGNWGEYAGENRGTGGMQGYLFADQSTGATLSGGTVTTTGLGDWIAVGFTIVPSAIGLNTVELGAIEWLSDQTLTATGSLDGLLNASGVTKTSSYAGLLNASGVTKTSSYAGLLNASGVTKTSSYDGLLLGAATKAASLDGLLNASGVTKTASLDALLGTDRNLVAYSQDFDNAAWLKDDTTVTPDAAVASDGTTVAELMTEGSANNAVIYQPVSAGVSLATDYTITMEVKRGNTDILRFLGFDTGSDIFRCWVDVNTGTILSSDAIGSATLSNAAIVSLGNGWYRVSLTGQINIHPPLYIGITTATADGSNNRVSGGTYYATRAQVEQSSSASPYVGTGTTKTKPASFDGLLNATVTKTASQDGLLNASDITKASSYDGLLLRVNTQTFNFGLDALFSPRPNTIALDARLFRWHDRSLAVNPWHLLPPVDFVSASSTAYTLNSRFSAILFNDPLALADDNNEYITDDDGDFIIIDDATVISLNLFALQNGDTYITEDAMDLAYE